MARNPRSPEHGAALLSAMIVVTLVASLAAAMVWRQYRAVQIETADRARAQATWILQGALDWAGLILREDARANQNEPVDHLGEVWAVPLKEARLSTFLAADKDDTSDGPEAFLSGQVSDAQAQYNLRQLLGGEQVPPLEMRTLQKLCTSSGVPSDTAGQIASKIRQAFSSDASPDAPLAPQSLDQLSWLGLSPVVIQKLRPFVVLLPQPTPVNVNTAPREVIAALFDGMDLGSAERLVQARTVKPLRNIQELKDYLPASATPDATRVSVASGFFFVDGSLRLDERVMAQHSLVQRINLDIRVISQERVNTLSQSP